MWTRLPLILVLLAFGVVLAVMPADAGSSRFFSAGIVCDGANKHFDFLAAGFPASSAQFTLGAEVTAIDPRGALLYVVIRGQGDEKKQILSIGPGTTHAGFAMPTFYQVTADASGQVLITIDGACTAGAGLVQAIVTIYFN
jgi:hypothetical protein